MKNIVWESEFSQRTKNGVQYWGIGKEMELIYIIETTRHEEDVKIDYSNVYKREYNSLNEVLHIFNEWQKAGYKNIQIVTNVKHNNEIIIEDVSECLELSINSEEMKVLKKESEQLESAKEELKTYRGFIKKYNAEKTFEKYLEESKTDKNKDQNGLYWYEMRLRPASIGAQPKGFVKSDETKGRHGIIAYDRPLTTNEVNEYDLSLWNVS
ncbi:hypothetical protein GCM10023310_70800 [Paenibacillus vulneris]|uniref:Defence against restriction A C-terminal domain-containing protein n=1 Tax=Paenibacillus vulneris TaxID=1133364 RepID=A0ABW3UG45_9BACL